MAMGFELRCSCTFYYSSLRDGKDINSGPLSTRTDSFHPKQGIPKRPSP